jgi:uncharacterized protein YjbI with pentapeptide repeats
MTFRVDNPKAWGLRRVLFGALLGMLATTLVAATAYGDKPTREEVVAYVDEFTSARRKMDLIERFGTDFSGLDLHGVSFRGDYKATGTNLRGTDFRDANLTGADFDFSMLNGADFTGADLTDARFYHASMRDVTLENANVSGTHFYASHLTEANMAGLDLSQSRIGVADFRGADLSDSTLAGADTEGYAPPAFHNANLAGADLHGLNLQRANLQDAILRGANLRGCQLEQANFAGADLQDADFENARLFGAVFEDVRGLSDDEKQGLSSRAARWRFLLETYIVAFLDSFAFPMLLLLVTPLAVIVARRRWKRLSPDAPARFQFRLSTLLLLTAVIGGFLAVAMLSPTGAYSYAMVGAFYVMIAEVVRGRASRKFSVGLLAAALVYPPMNLAVYFAVGAVDAFAFFDPPFMIGVVVVGPLLAIGCAIAAAIIAGRGKLRVLAQPLVGFAIWMIGVGFANVWLIGEIGASV